MQARLKEPGREPSSRPFPCSVFSDRRHEKFEFAFHEDLPQSRKKLGQAGLFQASVETWHAFALRGDQRQSVTQNAFDPISREPNYKQFAVKVEPAKGDEQR